MAIADKMVRRHPHVFGTPRWRAPEQSHAWEAHKAAERADKAGAAGAGQPRILDDVPLALLALVRAAKLQRRAARVGFDWPEAAQVLPGQARRGDRRASRRARRGRERRAA